MVSQNPELQKRRGLSVLLRVGAVALSLLLLAGSLAVLSRLTSARAEENRDLRFVRRVSEFFPEAESAVRVSEEETWAVLQGRCLMGFCRRVTAEDEEFPEALLVAFTHDGVIRAVAAAQETPGEKEAALQAFFNRFKGLSSPVEPQDVSAESETETAILAAVNQALRLTFVPSELAAERGWSLAAPVTTDLPRPPVTEPHPTLPPITKPPVTESGSPVTTVPGTLPPVTVPIRPWTTAPSVSIKVVGSGTLFVTVTKATASLITSAPPTYEIPASSEVPPTHEIPASTEIPPTYEGSGSGEVPPTSEPPVTSQVPPDTEPVTISPPATEPPPIVTEPPATSEPVYTPPRTWPTLPPSPFNPMNPK